MKGAARRSLLFLFFYPLAIVYISLGRSRIRDGFLLRVFLLVLCVLGVLQNHACVPICHAYRNFSFAPWQS